MPQRPAHDRLRQLTVTLGAAAMVVGTLVAMGLFGGPRIKPSTAMVASHPTYLTPARPAFLIWPLIFVLLLVYTVHQWLPRQTSRRVERRTGYLAAVAMALVGVRMVAAQHDWAWVGLACTLLLTGVLIRQLRVYSRSTDDVRFRDLIFLDATFGLSLGWTATAMVIDLGAAVATIPVHVPHWVGVLAGLAGVLLMGTVGTALAVYVQERLAVALAMAWGTAWIAFARLVDHPRSWLVAAVAVLVAAHVVGVTLWLSRHRAPRTRGRLQISATEGLPSDS